MIFRIHFEPKGGHFVIQFQKRFFGWETVQQRGQEPILEDLTFDTYDDAEKYVKDKGIDKAYDRRGSKGYLSGIQSGAIVQANVPHGYRLVPEAT